MARADMQGRARNDAYYNNYMRENYYKFAETSYLNEDENSLDVMRYQISLRMDEQFTESMDFEK